MGKKRFSSKKRKDEVEGVATRLIKTATHILGLSPRKCDRDANGASRARKRRSGSNEGKRERSDSSSSIVRVWRRWRRSDSGNSSELFPRLKSNMTESETQEHFRRIHAEHISSTMGPILALIIYHKLNRHIFNQPVDYVLLNIPQYPRIITNPMDLGTVRQKLQEGEYDSIESFAKDVRLVFANAMKFNPKKHPVHERAVSLLEIFEEAYSKAKNKFLQAAKISKFHTCVLCNDGKICPYCMKKCLKLDSPSLLCDCCHRRIPFRSYYYSIPGSTKSWCGKCYAKVGTSSRPVQWFETSGDFVTAADKGSEEETVVESTVVSKKRVKDDIDLEECYNGTVISEGWVQCASCSTQFHQACVLHNPWQSEAFVCMNCRDDTREQNEIEDEGEEEEEEEEDEDEVDSYHESSGRTLPRAESLPTTSLSNAVETKMRRTIHGEYQRRGDTPETAAHVAEAFTLREVSRKEKKISIPQAAMRALKCAFPHQISAYASTVPFLSRALYLFQRIDGVDVLLFALYVQEFGPDAPPANRNAVYISYLDSVHFMRPRFLRTPIYHAILTAYLADVKLRGFTHVHIWACPPTRGADYIFNRHPREQRTPGWERLRIWYNNMLLQAHAEGTVVEAASLYTDHFVLPKSDQRRPMLPPPYFPRHHWLKQLGTIVTNRDGRARAAERAAERAAAITTRRRSRSRSNSGSGVSKRGKQRKNSMSLVSKRKKIDLKSIDSEKTDCPTVHAVDLSKKLVVMSERLLVVRLQPMCTSCGQYIERGTSHAWQCQGPCCTSGDIEVKKPQMNLWGSQSSERLTPASRLIRSPIYLCRDCVANGKKGRLAQRLANQIAETYGHSPMRVWRHPRDDEEEEEEEESSVAEDSSASEELEGEEEEEEEFDVNDDMDISNVIVDTRGAFLNLCCGNHLQFDTLRHAKFSSMLVLHLLFQDHKECERNFIHYCNFCRLPIINDCRWHCKKCEDFDICVKCKKKLGTGIHKHRLTRSPVPRGNVFQWAQMRESKVIKLSNKRKRAQERTGSMKANETKRKKKAAKGKGSKKAPRWDSGVRPVYSSIAK